MAKLNLTTAFARYGAELINPQWSVTAISDSNELVMSCWSHYLSTEDGKLVYRDRLSRWEGKLGNKFARQHLEQARDDDLPVRLVIARAEDTAPIDAGEDASNVRKSFGVRQDLVGRVSQFDGDEFELVFVRED